MLKSGAATWSKPQSNSIAREQRTVGRQNRSEQLFPIGTVQQRANQKFRQAPHDRADPVPLVEVAACAVGEQPEDDQQQPAGAGFDNGCGPPEPRKQQRKHQISQELEADRPGRVVPAELARPNTLKHQQIGEKSAERPLADERDWSNRSAIRIDRRPLCYCGRHKQQQHRQMQGVDPRYPGLEKIPVMSPGHLPCEHPVVYVADDKPVQHQEQVDRQIALVDCAGITVGMNRWKMPKIVK
jgi:hypothetical protein